MHTLRPHHRALRLLGLLLLTLGVSMATAQTHKFVTEPLPPFNYLEGGDVAGPSYEIIRAVCLELGVECEFELTKWDRAIQLARDGEVNGIFSIGKNAEREEWMHYSTPILQTAYGVHVLKDDPLEYRQASDLAGYEVVTYGPSNTSKSLETLGRGVPSMTINVESKLRLALRKFDLGRYGEKSALYLNRDVVIDLTDELGLQNIRYAGDDRTLHYYVGFPKRSTTERFAADFNRVLEQFKQDGTLARLLAPFQMTPPR